MSSWPALLLAPLLALISQSVAYALVTPSCARQGTMILHAVYLIALALAVGCTLLAWRERREADAAQRPDDAAERGPRFLASVAALVGTLSCLVIFAMWIPEWFLSPCAS
ncbi:MAG: hypothetical protein ACTHL1_06425 [Burkholderiaceae bacterium]